MKKIFFSVTYLILTVMLFTYLVITPYIPGYSGYIDSLSGQIGFTGLPVIAIVLLIPLFVFDILALCINRKGIVFCREMIGFFASVFCLACAIIGIFYMLDAIYIPIIVIVCSIPLGVLTLLNIIKALKKEKTEESDN